MTANGPHSYNPGMRIEQITIIGVGLIGGSVGLAAKARGDARRVIGVDRDAAVLKSAVQLGAIDSGAATVAEGVAGSQLIVVCTPVDRIAEVILAAAPHCRPGTLFTDVGSVKGGLYHAVHGCLTDHSEFVPAHPLTGSEQCGVEHARADLFEDRVTVLTPEQPDIEADCVERFWTALGSRVVRMTPEDHDRALAVTSHLPHAVASAVAGSTSPELLSLTAGGFRDVTRIAAGDPALWAAIFQANRESVLAALDKFIRHMDEFKRLLEASDGAGLVRWLTEGKQVRDALGS